MEVNGLSRLRDAFASGSAVVVAGTGVASALSGGAAAATWIGLIESGILEAKKLTQDASSLKKGTRVIVDGVLVSRSYEKDGQNHTVFEVQVDEVGPSLRYATAEVTRVQRSQGGGGDNGSESRSEAPKSSGSKPAQSAPPSDDDAF